MFGFYLFSGLDELAAVTDGAALIKKLIAFGQEYGVQGNLFHHYLAAKLIADENPFSLSAERGQVGDSVTAVAEMDMVRIFEIYHNGLGRLSVGHRLASELSAYKSAPVNSFFTRRLCGLVAALDDAADEKQMLHSLLADYARYGVGPLSMHEAFRLSPEGDDAALEPVDHFDDRPLDGLVGYARQKAELLANTEAFLDGRPFNNVLLYGPAGTGKSSSVKALVPQFCDRGLKIVEVYKHQYRQLPRIIARLQRRGFRFILFLDDLSFEDFETEYKYFKAVLDGGLGRCPDNVAVYATSNRLHLIKENFSDRQAFSDDLHAGDTMQEKLSLSARFGLSVFYPAPDREEYLGIVCALAARAGIGMLPEELCRRALQWELTYAGKSGRTAEQFIKSLGAAEEA